MRVKRAVRIADAIAVNAEVVFAADLDATLKPDEVHALVLIADSGSLARRAGQCGEGDLAKG